jgi:hypothetical protein
MIISHQANDDCLIKQIGTSMPATNVCIVCNGCYTQCNVWERALFCARSPPLAINKLFTPKGEDCSRKSSSVASGVTFTLFSLSFFPVLARIICAGVPAAAAAAVSLAAEGDMEGEGAVAAHACCSASKCCMSTLSMRL